MRRRYLNIQSGVKTDKRIQEREEEEVIWPLTHERTSRQVQARKRGKERVLREKRIHFWVSSERKGKKK